MKQYKRGGKETMEFRCRKLFLLSENGREDSGKKAKNTALPQRVTLWYLKVDILKVLH
jgi:hypothetical protein